MEWYAVNWEHQETKPSYSFARLQNDQRRLLLFVFLVRRRPLSWEKGAGKGKTFHWKLGQQSATSGNSPAPFRNYGLDHIAFRNKTFLIFKIESWNFQHLKPLEVSTNQANSGNFYYHFFYLLSDWVEILWGFTIFLFKQIAFLIQFSVKVFVKVFNKNGVAITILSHLRSIDDRTYTTSQIIVDGEVQDEKLIETNIPDEEVADFEKEWEENCNEWWTIHWQMRTFPK